MISWTQSQEEQWWGEPGGCSLLPEQPRVTQSEADPVPMPTLPEKGTALHVALLAMAETGMLVLPRGGCSEEEV